MTRLENIMLSDDQLIKLSSDVDTFLFNLAKDHEMPALALSAVILARLLIINDEMKTTDDFKKLLEVVATTNRRQEPLVH
jgi:hypothetical protein